MEKQKKRKKQALAANIQSAAAALLDHMTPVNIVRISYPECDAHGTELLPFSLPDPAKKLEKTPYIDTLVSELKSFCSRGAEMRARHHLCDAVITKQNEFHDDFQPFADLLGVATKKDLQLVLNRLRDIKKTIVWLERITTSTPQEEVKKTQAIEETQKN